MLPEPLQDWPFHVAPAGTPFQRRVWQEIAAIPYGETITYSELAERAGRPAAIRAAASACGANPIPLLIPCHRVVGKHGSPGGFAWGLTYKKELLALEQGTASCKSCLVSSSPTETAHSPADDVRTSGNVCKNASVALQPYYHTSQSLPEGIRCYGHCTVLCYP